MQINNQDKLKQELQQMFQNKWHGTINYHIVPLVIEDIIKFMEKYENN